MKKLQDKGWSRIEVVEELERRLQRDLTYTSGQIMGSMCTKPHPFAKKTYIQCFEKNLGDPGVYLGTAELEREAVRMLGSLLSNPNASGHIVSGGTEANILALWVARNLAENNRREVILPVSSHFSFDKAADLLGLKPVKIGLDSRFQIDTEAVVDAITPKTMAIVGIAGTTDLGVVDPIPELSEIALAHKLFLHVDASFGGFVLPFISKIDKVIDFDFRLPGVCSITIDPHKMGMAPIPAGGILFRDSSMIKAVSIRAPYLSGGAVDQTTILGTRPGASAVAVWSLMMHLGKEGYRAVVERCVKITSELVEGVKKIKGITPVIEEPQMNVVGIKSDLMEIKVIAGELRRRGWAVSLFPHHIRVVIMPHVKTSHVNYLLRDLRRILRDYRN